MRLIQQSKALSLITLEDNIIKETSRLNIDIQELIQYILTTKNASMIDAFFVIVRDTS